MAYSDEFLVCGWVCWSPVTLMNMFCGHGWQSVLYKKEEQQSLLNILYVNMIVYLKSVTERQLWKLYKLM